MFFRSLFGQGKEPAVRPDVPVQTVSFEPAEPELIELERSPELLDSVEEYYWNQLGSFGGRFYRYVNPQLSQLPFDTDLIIDLVISVQENLFVCSCLDFSGEIYLPDNLYGNWLVKDSNGNVKNAKSPVQRNAVRASNLCAILQMSPRRVISNILFPDTTRFVNGSLQSSRLRVHTISAMKAAGTGSVEGITLSMDALHKIENYLDGIALPDMRYPNGTPHYGMQYGTQCAYCGHILPPDGRCVVCGHAVQPGDMEFIQPL